MVARAIRLGTLGRFSSSGRAPVSDTDFANQYEQVSRRRSQVAFEDARVQAPGSRSLGKLMIKLTDPKVVNAAAESIDPLDD